jgi:RHS repeat-associated protein
MASGYAFTGREWDAETGLYYYRARYYDPKIGRFLSEDPIGFMGGANFYAYVEGNPLTLVDPFGLSSDWEWWSDFWKDFWRQQEEAARAKKERDDAFCASIGLGPDCITEAGVPKPRLTACKIALRKVHELVGKLGKGKPGKFGSPQRGNSKVGYRLDPPHPGRPPGDPEAGWHINWWDWTKGKKGTGGRSGAVPICGCE